MRPLRLDGYNPAPLEAVYALAGGEREVVAVDWPSYRALVRRMSALGDNVDGAPADLLDWSFARASVGYRWTAAQQIEQIASNLPRLDHDPTSGASRGLLIEESRISRIIKSRDLTASAWTKRGTAAVAIDNSQVRIDGTLGANLVSGINGTGANDLYQIVTGWTPLATLSPSVWVKKVSASGSFRLNNAQNASNGYWVVNLALLGWGWERITKNHPAVTVVNAFVGLSSGTNGLHLSLAGGGPLSFYVDFCVLEEGPFSTSEAAADASAITRAADDCDFSLPTGFWQAGGNMIAVRGRTAGGASTYMGLSGVKLALYETSADLTSLVQGATVFFSGSELVSNGNFDTDTTGWTGVNATLSVVSNRLNIDVSAGFGAAYQALTLVIGKPYRLSVGFLSGASAQAFISTAPGTSPVVASMTAAGSVDFVATATTMYVNARRNTGSLGSLTVDTISVREIVTTVLYEDFGGYADVAAMVSAGSWIAISPGGVISSNRFNANSDAPRYYKNISATPGQPMTISATVSGTPNIVRVYDSAFAGVGAILATIVAGQTTKAIFTPTSSTITVYLYAGSANTGYWDNIRIDAVATDRSGNGNEPVVVGTVTRAAVASGATLAAYGGFTGAGRLAVPHNSTLAFGTADWVLGPIWFKTSGQGAANRLLDYGNYTGSAYSGAFAYLAQTTGGSLSFSVSDDGGATTDVVASPGTYADNNWHMAAVVRRGSTFELWVDAVKVANTAVSAAAASLTNTGASLGVGNISTGLLSRPFNGSLALPRVALGSAPTQSQMEALYVRELEAFQPGAPFDTPTINATYTVPVPQVFVQFGEDGDQVRIERETNGHMKAVAVTGGATVCDIDLGSVADGTDFAVAFSLKDDDFKASLNGGAVVSDTGGTMPTGIEAVRVGRDQYGFYANGWQKQLLAIARPAASGAEVQGLAA